MAKIDRRIHYIMGIDTETCNSLATEDDKLDLSQSLVYDIGWVITDKRGRIYKKRSFIIYEIFVQMRDVMATAYYADKIPMYWEQIQSGQRRLVRFQTMYNIFWEDVKEYGIDSYFAHNAQFDVKALNNTIRWVTKSKKRYFFPFNAEIWCTLKMRRQVIANKKSYNEWCKHYEFLTKHKPPRSQLTAEVLYRFITGNVEFEESHTGLEDVLIETEILVYCFRQHKKMDKVLYPKRCA